jgi:hypothetical protein
MITPPRPPLVERFFDTARRSAQAGSWPPDGPWFTSRKERSTLSTNIRPSTNPVSAADTTRLADDSLLPMIKPEKILDLIGTKQTQFYSLWAVYTAVQFAAGSYGGGGAGKPPLYAVLAILVGFWLFNIGHLGFILQCVAQLGAFRAALEQIALNDKVQYRQKLNAALYEMHEGRWFWNAYRHSMGRFNYHMQWVVHISIDICATLALLLRVDDPVLQSHFPAFLRALPTTT